MTDVFNVEEAPKFSDPLLEFLTQAEQEEKPSARNRSSSSASSSKPSAIPPAITTTKNVSAQPTDFKKMEEATDGHDFLSLIEQHTKKKPTSRSNYNDDLEKELNEPFMEPPRPTLPQMVEEFETVWDKENETDINLDALNLKAQRGGLQNTRLRGLCWKIFLGTCTGKNPSEWLGELQAYRDDYDRLNQQYLIDPHKNETELDLQLNNPLSLASDSPWQQYFQDAELKKQIRLDVIRVYPEREFFKNERIREMMLRLLFIYARENPMLMYKQGMHELLAPILYILDREKISADDLPQTEPATEEEHKTRKVEKFLAETNDSRYVEHDAYVMFRKVMDISGKWFMSSSHRPPPQPTKIIPDAPFSRPEEPLDISSSSPIVQKCKRIQQELLKRADPELHGYLTSMQMEPQLYALRWVRLLLGREFHLEDVLILWDAIFSYGKDFVLVDYVIVAMLIYIRTQLIDKEQQECLHRLFNYPPVEDVLCLIEHALVLINPALMTPTAVSKEKKEAPAEPQETVEHPAETIQVSPPPTSATTSAQPPTSKGKKDPKKQKKSFMSTINSIISEPPKEPKKPSPLEQQIALQQHQIHQLEQRQLHMSNRLERIVYTLQRELAANNTEESEEAREERRDSMLLALAELKVIKDTLAGLLPETGEGEGEATGNGDPLGVGHM